MIALLDVDVLVALFDPSHTHHEPAHNWFARERSSGWATCPITENGLVRVISDPGYPGRRSTVNDVVDRLRSFRQSGDHAFWSDMLSICESTIFEPANLGSHRKLTDLYLLALAVENGGRLATFDRAIPVSAVVAAEDENLTLIR